MTDFTTDTLSGRQKFVRSEQYRLLRIRQNFFMKKIKTRELVHLGDLWLKNDCSWTNSPQNKIKKNKNKDYVHIVTETWN